MAFMSDKHIERMNEDKLLETVDKIEAQARERFLNNVEFKYVNKNLVSTKLEDNIVTIPLNKNELKEIKKLYDLLGWYWSDN